MRLALIHRKMGEKRGAQNIVVWLAHGLRMRGHQIRVITEEYDPRLWPAEMREGISVELIAPTRLERLLNWKRFRSLGVARRLGRALQGFDAAIATHFPTYRWAVQARERVGGTWRVIWLCQEPRRSFYPRETVRHLLRWRQLTPADVENPHLAAEAAGRLKRSWWQRMKDARNRRWDADAARKCDLVITNSLFTAENFRRIFGFSPAVCHLGIPMSQEPEYRPGHYVAILTSLAPLKNVQNVLWAVRHLARRSGCRDIRLSVAGTGGDRMRLERLARDLQIAKHVEFAGALTDTQLPRFYNQARLVAYCPIDEPFGLVPLEAMAAKTPVVVSDHGGPGEIVEHGQTGLRVNPFDPAAIADAIERLWTNPDLARRLGEAGYRKVSTCFSLEAFVERFEALVRACVNGERT